MLVESLGRSGVNYLASPTRLRLTSVTFSLCCRPPQRRGPVPASWSALQRALPVHPSRRLQGPKSGPVAAGRCSCSDEDGAEGKKTQHHGLSLGNVFVVSCVCSTLTAEEMLKEPSSWTPVKQPHRICALLSAWLWLIIPSVLPWVKGQIRQAPPTMSQV